jgi:phosphoglycerate dehydrogenase-like enzyme
MSRPTALFVLPQRNFELIYGAELAEQIGALVELLAPPVEPAEALARPDKLAEAELIFTGWGSLSFTPVVLAAAPRLRMLFYGAGTVHGTVTEAFWERGVRVTSAWAANAVPVVEYTVGQVFLCLKRAYQHAAAYRAASGHLARLPVAGGYGSTVGLVSLGMVGRMVAQRLQAFDVQLMAYDPYVDAASGAELGVRMASLEDVFRQADVVSLHAPWLDSTVGMIHGEHLRMMKPGASFINTARGAVVREDEMIAALAERPDLFAVLDVTWPEPAAADSPLFSLPNVFLTPHIAGSMDGECRRMGQTMFEELQRYLRGEPLRYEVTRERAAILA